MNKNEPLAPEFDDLDEEVASTFEKGCAILAGIGLGVIALSLMGIL